MLERVDGLLGGRAARHVGDDVPRRLRPDPARRGRSARLPAELHDLRPGRPDARRARRARGRARQGSEALPAARRPRPHLRREEPARLGPSSSRERGRRLLRPDRRRGLRRATSGASRRPARWTSTTCWCTPSSCSSSVARRAREVAGAFRHVLVDEYQDTNHAQYRLVRAAGGAHGNVCVVGDSDQSIYSWRGADIRNILDFERDFPDAARDPARAELPLDAAHPRRRERRDRPQRRPPREAALVATSAAASRCAWSSARTSTSEARLVVAQIGGLLDEGYVGVGHRGLLPHERAVARDRGPAPAPRHRPTRSSADSRFYDRAEIKDALAYLQVLDNPADAISLRRIINAPRRGIGDTTVVAAGPARRGVRHDAAGRARARPTGAADRGRAQGRARVLASCSTRARAGARASRRGRRCSSALLDDSGYRDALREERRSRPAAGSRTSTSWSAWRASSTPATTGRRLETFLQELSLVSDADEDEHSVRSLVTLMTLHTAKGLEFPVVFLVGMEDGVFPHQRAIEEANLEEERRLCYVGMTRARERLTLRYCRSRTLFGSRNSNPPSLFLAEIPPTSSSTSAAPSAPSASHRRVAAGSRRTARGSARSAPHRATAAPRRAARRRAAARDGRHRAPHEVGGGHRDRRSRPRGSSCASRRRREGPALAYAPLERRLMPGHCAPADRCYHRGPGRLAQLVEHQLDKLGVTGSSPVPPIPGILPHQAGFLRFPAFRSRCGSSVRGAGSPWQSVFVPVRVAQSGRPRESCQAARHAGP